MVFCTFVDERGETVYVNPSRVTHFTALTPHRMLTKITFDENNSVVVKGTPKEIAAGLMVREG